MYKKVSIELHLYLLYPVLAQLKCPEPTALKEVAMLFHSTTKELFGIWSWELALGLCLETTVNG